MDEELLRKKVITLFKEGEIIQREIEKIQKQLVQQLCPKEKIECEPEYCIFRITDTCPFIKKWSDILEEAQVAKETKYDLFINFVEKVLEDKGVSKKNT